MLFVNLRLLVRGLQHESQRHVVKRGKQQEATRLICEALNSVRDFEVFIRSMRET